MLFRSAAAPSHFLAKREVERWPLIGNGARALGTIFVCRKDRQSRADSRREIERALVRGRRVVVFPEGTTSADGLLPFRTGSIEAAVKAGVAVTPVAVHYSRPDAAWVGDEGFLPHFLRFFRHRGTRAWVSFGPALDEGTVEEVRDQAQRWIAAEVEKLSAQRRSDS